MVSTAFAALSDKLLIDTDAVLQVCGDSTGQGLFGWTGVDQYHGWVGRLGRDIGAGYDVNVRYRGASYPGSVTWVGWVQDEMLYTTTRPGAATLTIWNGSCGGAQAPDLVSWITGAQNLIPNPNPDVAIIACGFNDAIRGANLSDRLQSLANAIRARCTTTPIVITTQNKSMGNYPTAAFDPLFSVMSQFYVSQSIPLDPALIASSAAGVWVMDTRQAYSADILSTLLSLNDTVGGLHPNSAGYQTQADWMYQQFLAGAVITPGDGGGGVPSGLFQPDRIPTARYKLIGLYYPARFHVRVGGSFVPVLPRY